MDEDNIIKPQPIFAKPYKEESAPQGPRIGDLLHEPPAPPVPAPLPSYQRPASDLSADSGASAIRTFQSDVAHAIQDKNTSVAQIALAEGRKRQRIEDAQKENSAGSKKNIALIALSAGLFFAALGIAGYILWPAGDSQQVPVVPGERPLILTESSKMLAIDYLDRQGLVEALQKEVQGNREGLGTVSRIIPTKISPAGKPEPANAQAFIGILAEGIPDTLLRSLEPQFYFGIYVFQKNEPYLILKVDSYQAAFGGMIEWEKRMPYDLADVFIAAANRASTLNSRVAFRDEVVSNKDARALTDSISKQTVLLYSFVDKNTLVITTNERTLQEIAERISRASLIK